MKKILFLMLVTGCGLENSQLRLRTAIDTQQDKLHRCYAQALMNDAELEGTMQLTVRVPAHGDGKIDMVEASGESQLTNPKLHPALQRCVQRALLGLPIGGVPIQDDLYVEYTLQLAPDPPNG